MRTGQPQLLNSPPPTSTTWAFIHHRLPFLPLLLILKLPETPPPLYFLPRSEALCLPLGLKPWPGNGGSANGTMGIGIWKGKEIWPWHSLCVSLILGQKGGRKEEEQQERETGNSYSVGKQNKRIMTVWSDGLDSDLSITNSGRLCSSYLTDVNFNFFMY